ncbi:PAS domain S-box protein [Salinirubellus salinus]|uniref:PAS domain S-box protein n=1 Tax=Salinirubellus salinus TaxID=1364945 RepID=A0A9E7UD03_9EURY|nr:PAS domain-containing protein [Salinirubellus salinus]UWM56479.1 PAS domain S-box protein [Salinirubellus salinus]
MTVDTDTSDASQYRRRLYQVLAEESVTLSERVVAALEVGREYLGVENGHVARIDRDRDRREVYLSTGDADGVVTEGEVSALATSYCRVTLERESPLAMSDVPAEPGWEDRYAEHGVGCYLGVELTLGEETFGTLCFVDRDARSRSFTEAERSFAELVARSVERELASARYEDRLDEHREAIDTRERRLERSERKYESLVETAPDAIVLVDTDTEELAEANAAAADLTGYAERDLVSTAWRELVVGVAPDDDDVGDRLVDRLVAADGPVDSHPDGSPLRVRHRDGSAIPVEVSASHVTLDDGQYVQAVFRDVTERRERQRELRLKDRAIEEAQVGITIAEAGEAEDPLVYANPEFTRLTGYDREAVIGRDCRLLQGERTNGGTTAALGEAIEAGEPVQQEVLNYRADGTPFWNEVTVTPVHDADGDVTHFVGFQRDVTERKRRETLVSVLNRVLRHNLRNDMTVVRGHAALLASEYDGPVAESGETIAETAEELVALSEKARTLEQVADDPGDPAERDPVTVAESVVDRVREQYPEADIAVRTAAESVPPVLGTDRLERALFEVVENAAQHAGAASTVRVVVATDDDGVTVRVSDEGPGLASNERAVLDGRSETPLEHGTGLGLWLANWIVTGIGGELEVVDPEGEGTTLEVGLRTATQRAVEAGEPTPSAIGLDD